MTARRGARRRGQRGSAMVVVAVGAVALIGATGLAIDGGMAAGAYRHAQNAADAGALAAVRTEYDNFMSALPTTTSSLTPVATKEVQHNGAQFTSLTSGGVPGSGGSGSTTVWVPNSTGGMTAQAAFADMSTSIPTVPATLLTPAIPGFDIDVLANRAYGTINMQPISGTGSTASGEAETMHFSAPALDSGTSGDVNCSQSQSAYNTATVTSDCSGLTSNGATGTLTSGLSQLSSTAPLSTVLTPSLVTVGASPNASSSVSSTNAPSATPSMNVSSYSQPVVNPLTNVTLAGVGASSVHSDDVVGWDTLTSAAVTTANVSASNVSVTSPLVDVSATNLGMSVSISMGPTDTHPVITPSCAVGTLTFSAGATLAAEGASAAAAAAGTSTIDKDCNVTAPPSIPNVTITGPWYSPSKDYSRACTSSAGTWSCSLQTCLLRIVDSTTNTTICLMQSILVFGVAPMTVPVTAMLPQYVGAVTVTAHVPQTTYFMRVLGWNQTDPSATGTAAIANVVDESQSAFAASPFAMPNAATIMGGAAGQTQCTFTFKALLTGCYYYLYGTDMQTYNPSILGSSFEGQLASTSAHRVDATGATTVTSAGPRTMPLRTYQGTSYYLEPVFDAAWGNVLYYAVFLPVAGHDNWGELVNSVPSLNGPIVTADTGAGWAGLTPGALSIKVVS